MNTAQFWQLIDKARAQAQDDPDTQLQILSGLLEALPAEEIVAFDHIFSQCFDQSYTWALWGAAYVIGGGCSDDGFDYFRGWLISRGEPTFSAALADPDSLAELITDADEAQGCEVEGWQSVAVDAWCAQTGQSYEAFPAIPLIQPQSATGPAGEEWSEDELDARYPRLAARFS